MVVENKGTGDWKLNASPDDALYHMSTTVPGTKSLNIHLEYKGPVPFTPLRSSSGLSGILSPPNR